jgi:hypothetical protein
MRKIMINLCVLIAVALVAGCSSSGGGGNTFLETHDYDSDGRISRDEYHRSFDSIDYNGDAHLDDSEVGSVLSGH